MGKHTLRIAQIGWGIDRAAGHVDEVSAGVRCMWIEIDGNRFDNLIEAHIKIRDNEFTTPVVTMEFAAPIEIVYTDSDGVPLPGNVVEASSVGLDGKTLAHDRVMRRPSPFDDDDD